MGRSDGIIEALLDELPDFFVDRQISPPRAVTSEQHSPFFAGHAYPATSEPRYAAPLRVVSYRQPLPHDSRRLSMASDVMSEASAVPPAPSARAHESCPLALSPFDDPRRGGRVPPLPSPQVSDASKAKPAPPASLYSVHEALARPAEAAAAAPVSVAHAAVSAHQRQQASLVSAAHSLANPAVPPSHAGLYSVAESRAQEAAQPAALVSASKSLRQPLTVDVPQAHAAVSAHPRQHVSLVSAAHSLANPAVPPSHAGLYSVAESQAQQQEAAQPVALVSASESLRQPLAATSAAAAPQEEPQLVSEAVSLACPREVASYPSLASSHPAPHVSLYEVSHQLARPAEVPSAPAETAAMPVQPSSRAAAPHAPEAALPAQPPGTPASGPPPSAPDATPASASSPLRGSDEQAARLSPRPPQQQRPLPKTWEEAKQQLLSAARLSTHTLETRVPHLTEAIRRQEQGAAASAAAEAGEGSTPAAAAPRTPEVAAAETRTPTSVHHHYHYHGTTPTPTEDAPPTTALHTPPQPQPQPHPQQPQPLQPQPQQQQLRSTGADGRRIIRTPATALPRAASPPRTPVRQGSPSPLGPVSFAVSSPSEFGEDERTVKQLGMDDVLSIQSKVHRSFEARLSGEGAVASPAAVLPQTRHVSPARSHGVDAPHGMRALEAILQGAVQRADRNDELARMALQMTGRLAQRSLSRAAE